jgi:hypothetical protein
MIRRLSNKYFEPISMWLMILGLICIVQPWSMLLHRYAVPIILISLVAFVFFRHIEPLPEEE